MKILKIGVIILTIAVVLPSVVLVSRIWDPLWNPFRPSPEEVVEKMIEQMQAVKSFSYDILADSQNTQNELISSFSLKIKEDVDNNNKKLSGIFEIILELGEVSINFGIEHKNIEKDSYYKTIKASDIPGLPIDFSQTKDQWIKQEGESEFNQINIVKELFKDKDMYVVQEEIGDEKIDNKEMYHYIVKPNKEKIEALLQENFGDNSEGSLNVGTLANDSLKGSLDDLMFDIWIGKKDYYVYKIKAEAESGKFEMNLSNFNKSFSIEAPEDFKTLEDLNKI